MVVDNPQNCLAECKPWVAGKCKIGFFTPGRGGGCRYVAMECKMISGVRRERENMSEFGDVGSYLISSALLSHWE